MTGDQIEIRDHGGDLDRARAAYGGAAGEWIDLSTGINRLPYPIAGARPRGSVRPAAARRAR